MIFLQEPAANHLPQTTLEDGTPLPSDQISLLDFPDMDKLSIVSETDSGVVCNSRPSSYVGTPSVANIFIQSLQVKYYTHIAGLDLNRRNQKYRIKGVTSI